MREALTHRVPLSPARTPPGNRNVDSVGESDKRVLLAMVGHLERAAGVRAFDVTEYSPMGSVSIVPYTTGSTVVFSVKLAPRWQL